MKIIRRTQIKIKRKELVIANNESPEVCPICNFPIPPKIRSSEISADIPANDDEKPSRLQTDPKPNQ